jgi:DNA polymerase-3 subunit beta
MTPGVPVTVRLRSDRDRDAERAREYGDTRADDPDPGRSTPARAADAMIGFESGGRRLTTRLIGGEYIKYRSRFPDEFACRADLSAAPFIEAVRRVSLVAERGSAVRLTFGGGEVTVAAETQGRARAREIISADFRGVEPAIAFSPHFLLDGIVAAGVSAAPPGHGDQGGGLIRLEFNSSTKPAVVTGVPAAAEAAEGTVPPGPGFRYLVVPLRTAGRR